MKRIFESDYTGNIKRRSGRPSRREFLRNHLLVVPFAALLLLASTDWVSANDELNYGSTRYGVSTSNSGAGYATQATQARQATQVRQATQATGYVSPYSATNPITTSRDGNSRTAQGGARRQLNDGLSVKGRGRRQDATTATSVGRARNGVDIGEIATTTRRRDTTGNRGYGDDDGYRRHNGDRRDRNRLDGLSRLNGASSIRQNAETQALQSVQRPAYAPYSGTAQRGQDFGTLANLAARVGAQNNNMAAFQRGPCDKTEKLDRLRRNAANGSFGDEDVSRLRRWISEGEQAHMEALATEEVLYRRAAENPDGFSDRDRANRDEAERDRERLECQLAVWRDILRIGLINATDLDLGNAGSFHNSWETTTYLGGGGSLGSDTPVTGRNDDEEDDDAVVDASDDTDETTDDAGNEVAVATGGEAADPFPVTPEPGAGFDSETDEDALDSDLSEIDGFASYIEAGETDGDEGDDAGDEDDDGYAAETDEEELEEELAELDDFLDSLDAADTDMGADDDGGPKDHPPLDLDQDIGTLFQEALDLAREGGYPEYNPFDGGPYFDPSVQMDRIRKAEEIRAAGGVDAWLKRFRDPTCTSAGENTESEEIGDGYAAETDPAELDADMAELDDFLEGIDEIEKSQSDAAIPVIEDVGSAPATVTPDVSAPATVAPTFTEQVEAKLRAIRLSELRTALARVEAKSAEYKGAIDRRNQRVSRLAQEADLIAREIEHHQTAMEDGSEEEDHATAAIEVLNERLAVVTELNRSRGILWRVFGPGCD